MSASDPDRSSGPACARCGGIKHHTGSRWRCSNCYNDWQKNRRINLAPDVKAQERAMANEIRLGERVRWSPERHAVEVARSQAWREANAERHRQNARDWYAANTERARATKLAEYYADKGAFIARNMVRKARLRDAICAHGESCVSAEFLADLYAQACFYCGGETTDADHFTPLARGGLHCRENLVPACGPCNGSKHARDPIEFLVGIRGDQ